MCVCVCVCASQAGYLGRGKGKCFRGKWISSRIRQRHSKQPLPTPDRSCTIRVHAREAEEPWGGVEGGGGETEITAAKGEAAERSRH